MSAKVPGWCHGGKEDASRSGERGRHVRTGAPEYMYFEAPASSTHSLKLSQRAESDGEHARHGLRLPAYQVAYTSNSQILHIRRFQASSASQNGLLSRPRHLPADGRTLLQTLRVLRLADNRSNKDAASPPTATLYVKTEAHPTYVGGQPLNRRQRRRTSSKLTASESLISLRDRAS
ncbi:hypothetical protein BV20DRAFT_721327 [Pilatotrama ljubarskyi]|nr:hypothetical protein BV20DRAFT_721327 [Pilatotrama ljubarskyi]